MLDQGGRLFPIEIKSGRTISDRFFDGLRYFQPLAGALSAASFLIYGGNEVQARSITQVVSWKNLSRIPL